MIARRTIVIAVLVVLLAIVAFQVFVALPQQDRFTEISSTDMAPPVLSVAAAPSLDRDAALADDERVAIDTPRLAGSLNLEGGVIDDLRLKDYRETVDPDSPPVTLLAPLDARSPQGAPAGYAAEAGWLDPRGGLAIPDDAVWAVEGDARTLTTATPVTLIWDNGQGAVFRRTVAVDDQYLFTLTQSVTNSGPTTLDLTPFARIARIGTPDVANTMVLHQGPIGVLGERNRVQVRYQDVLKATQSARATGGWLGFTDKYFAAAILADPAAGISARFTAQEAGDADVHEASFARLEPLAIAPGATASDTSYLFAGAKVEAVIKSYEDRYHFDRFEQLIDWGILAWLSQPMFYLLRFLHGLVGNFGVAILLITVLVKLVLFPLSYRSFVSIAAMRRIRPEEQAIRAQFKGDLPVMQQEIAALYRRSGVQPLSGCWPVLIQIPVFFALYSVLYVTIEMRHAPFFGWIADLAARDPTNIFNLFGLLPFDPATLPVFGGLLAVGVWPLLMGLLMWVQFRVVNPPSDPVQVLIFSWLPVLFIFMLSGFPAGLVIYWTWNSALSILQQLVIMRQQGVKIGAAG